VSTRPVLFLDGPLKGEVRCLETRMYASRPFPVGYPVEDMFRVPMATSMPRLLERYDAPDYSTWDAVDYCIRALMLFGQKLRFATLSYPSPSEDRLNEMLWEMLASGYAQRLRDGITT
jgi:hypothetical protein